MVAGANLELPDTWTDEGGSPSWLAEQNVCVKYSLHREEVLHNGQAPAGSDGEVFLPAVAGVGSRLQEGPPNNGPGEGGYSGGSSGRT